MRMYRDHSRNWREFVYVYPVLSRRSKGLSIGVNLNPNKLCNWDCVYCQVDRTTPGVASEVDEAQLEGELESMLAMVGSGEIWEDEKFAGTPDEMKRINDIAFAGDGEPTTYPRFDAMCEMAAGMKGRFGLGEVKLIVLSNMTVTHRPAVQTGFDVVYREGGEVWAKLDAGRDEYFKQVDRAGVKLERVLRNIGEAARKHPLVIQSLFMRLHGDPTPPEEFEAYLDRLEEVVLGGGRIKLVQLYTIARDTTEAYATPLSDGELDGLAERFRERLGGVACEVFYGVG